MRKPTKAEIRLLQSVPTPINFCGVMCGGATLPGMWPKGTRVDTIRNAVAMGLLKVARIDLFEYYPLELTEKGKEVLRFERQKGSK